jgi:hypothetical protein
LSTSPPACSAVAETPRTIRPINRSYGIVIDDISGSATFSNTKVSGTPSGGLSNPTTTFTIVRGPRNAGF